jgi:hypothetical protein
VELELVTLKQSVMANLLPCLPRFSTPQIDLIKIALAAYCGLPRQPNLAEIALTKRHKLRDALVYALRKGHLTFTEAQEIASIIGVSLYNR